MFLLPAVFSALSCLLPSTRAGTRTWTHNSSQLWSDPNNWSPVGVPQTGDDLLFTDEVHVSGPDPMMNDITNLSVRSMSFLIDSDDSLITPDWNLNGNAITITGPIATHNFSDTERIYINCGLIIGLAGAIVNDSSVAFDCEIHVTGPVDLNGNNLTLLIAGEPTLEVSSVISGTGNVIAIGDLLDGGTITFSGSQANTFHGKLIASTQGTTDVGNDFGNVLLNKQSAVAVPEDLRVEYGAVVTLGGPGQIADTASVEVVGTALGGKYWHLSVRLRLSPERLQPDYSNPLPDEPRGRHQ